MSGCRPATPSPHSSFFDSALSAVCQDPGEPIDNSDAFGARRHQRNARRPRDLRRSLPPRGRADRPHPRGALLRSGRARPPRGPLGLGLYIILDGEAAVIAGGKRVNTLGRGEFFGEISVLLGEAPVADIIAARPLRCLVLPGELLKEFLQMNPRVCYRILVAEARKLANATRRGG